MDRLQLFQHFETLAETRLTAAQTTATHLLDATLHQILTRAA